MALPLRPLLLLLSCLMPLAAAAVDLDDLLPVEEAFVLSARAPGPDRIEIEWKIADGYYLYRHRTDVQATGGFDGGTLVLPRGKAYTDEFFGDVETYRGTLTATLPGQALAGAALATLRIKYQGCADVGICYPPQTRTLTVKLPGADAAAGGFTPLGRLGLPGAAGALAGGTAGANALPLPEQQAFGLEAVAMDGGQLLLRFTPARGYYLYRDRTSMRLSGTDGITLQAPRWPAGKPHRDEHFGEVTVYFDAVEVPVPLHRTRARAAAGTLHVTFQGCQTDGICYPPMTRQIALSIPAGAVSAAGTPASPAPETPVLPDAARIATPDPAAANGASSPLPNEAGADETPRTPPPADVLQRAGRAPVGFAVALLLALAGGLVLNLMPCVLPVLSLKALSLAGGGGQARAQALWYTAGVLLGFVAIGAVALALRAAGQALGWGFQLQQPWVVGALAYVMFAVGLSLSGVFAVGYRLAGVGAPLTTRSGPAGDFFTGLLAVVIASPCTAPFMGVALAFAFASPVPLALTVFAALGLGLALPFLLIGFVPALARRLPRPGPWMETLRQVLAFPMYLTAIWLLWVLGKQRGIDAAALLLAGMVLLAAGLWGWQRLRWKAGATLPRLLAAALVLAALVPLAMAQKLPRVAAMAASSSGSESYSPQRLAALRAEGRVVFVDMTADWCITCKANEKAVLHTDRFAQAMRRHDAVLMTGDWTDVDPDITAFLQSHKAVGVPLYVVFPRSGGSGVVLPTVLTHGIVERALEQAAR